MSRRCPVSWAGSWRSDRSACATCRVGPAYRCEEVAILTMALLTMALLTTYYELTGAKRSPPMTRPPKCAAATRVDAVPQ
eukprot:scaffold57508_cov81-Phaeocystis_antarctica.AAC.3